MRLVQRVCSVLCIVALAVSWSAIAQPKPTNEAPTVAKPIAERVAAFDLAFFRAFNTCDMAALEKLTVPNLEFFHDLGGTMRGREAFLKSVKENVCGKFTRKVVSASVESWTLGKEGAIYSGTHHFCHHGKVGCQGQGRFLHILEERDGTLVLVRVVSYDHREIVK